MQNSAKVQNANDITRRSALVLGGAALVSPFLANTVKAQTSNAFEINIPDAVIDDLYARLAATRMPDQIAGSGWGYGTDTTYLADLTTYWRTEYD